MTSEIEAENMLGEGPGSNRNGSKRPQLDSETKAKLNTARTRFQMRVGQIVLAMLNLPRYRHNSLTDLTHIVLDPLTRDRIAVATPKGEGEDEALAGMAIWASVSDEVDGKITEQVKAGAFPIRLKGEDWVSGETVWLLDVIAPNRSLATAVLTNFRQLAEDKPVKIHPMVARLVDPEFLKKMRTAPR